MQFEFLSKVSRQGNTIYINIGQNQIDGLRFNKDGYTTIQVRDNDTTWNFPSRLWDEKKNRITIKDNKVVRKDELDNIEDYLF